MNYCVLYSRNSFQNVIGMNAIDNEIIMPMRSLFFSFSFVLIIWRIWYSPTLDVLRSDRYAWTTRLRKFWRSGAIRGVNRIIDWVECEFPIVIFPIVATWRFYATATSGQRDQRKVASCSFCIYCIVNWQTVSLANKLSICCLFYMQHFRSIVNVVRVSRKLIQNGNFHSHISDMHRHTSWTWGSISIVYLCCFADSSFSSVMCSKFEISFAASRPDFRWQITALKALWPRIRDLREFKLTQIRWFATLLHAFAGNIFYANLPPF